MQKDLPSYTLIHFILPACLFFIFVLPSTFVLAEEEISKTAPADTSPEQSDINNETIPLPPLLLESVEDEDDILDTGNSKITDNKDTTKESGVFSFLDEPHKEFSTGIERISSNMDSFFSNERFYRVTTSSYVRFRTETLLREPSDVSTTGDIRIRLDLPVTRQKLKLIIESDPQELEAEERINLQTSNKEENNDVYVGLERKEKKKGNWRIRPSVGVKVKLPLDLYVRLRFMRSFNLSKWKLHFNETLYWFDSIGYGADTYIDLERKISDKTLFRSSSTANWADLDDYFRLSQFFTLFHTLSDRRATSYYVGVIGKSQPEIYATDYLIGFQFRQKIHKDWLFFEINPQIQYPKIEKFRPSHTLLIRLEAFFGTKYL
ncbi:MAG: hypothetical protein OQK73_07950 [Gammaproteobacteria bacterium]|nr:hypothetical protein [Gammaproteobacteria bacterium]